MRPTVPGLVLVLSAASCTIGSTHAADRFGTEAAAAARNAGRAAEARQRAEGLCGQGDSAGAIAALTEAIELEPKNADHFALRGQCWLGIKDFGQALLDVNEALALDPNNRRALFARDIGRSLRSTDAMLAESPHDAIRFSTEAIAFDPLNAKGYYDRAGVLGRHGKHDQAIADYNVAIRLDPTKANYYRRRGKAWNKQGDLAQADADFQRALLIADEAVRLHPDRAECLVERASIFDAQNDFDRAIADYDAALRLRPGDAEIEQMREVAVERQELDQLIRGIDGLTALEHLLEGIDVLIGSEP